MQTAKSQNKLRLRLALLTCFVALQLCASFSYAQGQALQWEVSGDANLFANDSLTKQFGFDTAYFLKPLEYTKGPYSERYFLNPTDSIRLSTQLESTTIETTNIGGKDASLSYTRVMGKHILTPQVNFSEYEGRSAFGTGLNYTQILRDGVQASINARIANEELSTGSANVTALGVGYRKLWQFRKSRSLATQLKLEYTRARNESQTNSIFALETEFDYYFNNRWRVGLGMNVSSSENSRYQSVGLGVSTELYVTSKFSLEFEAKAKEQDGFLDAGLLLNAKIYFD